MDKETQVAIQQIALMLDDMGDSIGRIAEALECYRRRAEQGSGESRSSGTFRSTSFFS